MQILSQGAVPRGYEPGFVDLNCEEGVLEISHSSTCELIKDAEQLAETIILRCTLTPIACTHRQTKVQLVSENSPLESAVLYDETMVIPGYDRSPLQSQWEAIAVEYKGLGWEVRKKETFSFSETTLSSGRLEIKNPLYIKPFKTDTASSQVRVTTIGEGQVITSPPGVLNTRVLRGYGGYYQPGIPLTEIEQVYYALTSDYEQTKVRLYSSAFLKARHISPPFGGREFDQDIVFSPSPQQEEYLSFSSAIAAGYARLSVHTDLGVISYASCSCELIADQHHFVHIHFKPLF